MGNVMGKPSRLIDIVRGCGESVHSFARKTLPPSALYNTPVSSIQAIQIRIFGTDRLSNTNEILIAFCG